MKLEDNFRKAGGEFREFKIGDLFTQYRGKEKAPNQNEVGDSQLINETSTNNGWTRLVTPTKIFKGNAITISINYAKTVFYQPKDFCASVNISILRNDKILNRYSGLYIATLLSKSNERYSYTTKTSKDKINNTTILLPAKKDGSLALDYMEAYIKTIELEKSRAIEAYLESIGLKNYELSEEEKEALDLLSRARNGGGS